MHLYRMEKFRKLTPHDLAFGIGRKATKEKLEELVNRQQGAGMEALQFLEQLKERNAAEVPKPL